MGRPPGRPPSSAAIDATSVRSRRHHAVIKEGQLDHFPRRYPRLGPSFQASLPETTTALAERPAPVKMSSELPYRTEQEVQRCVSDEYGKFLRSAVIGDRGTSFGPRRSEIPSNSLVIVCLLLREISPRSRLLKGLGTSVRG